MGKALEGRSSARHSREAKAKMKDGKKGVKREAVGGLD